MAPSRKRPLKVQVLEGIKMAKTTAREIEDTLPDSKVININGQDIDTKQAFFLYCSFSGDAEKTAHSLGITPVEVLEIARAEEWSDKLAPILKLKKSKRPGDVERGLSRSMNFVQAHQMRLVLQRLMSRFSRMTDEELLSYCLQEVTTTKKDGTVTIEKKLTTRPFADLASALEKCHMLTYYSLGDTTTERGRKGDEEEGPTQIEMHSAIADALSKVGNTPQAKLLEAQIARAQEVKETDIVTVKLQQPKRDSSTAARLLPQTSPVNDNETPLPASL